MARDIENISVLLQQITELSTIPEPLMALTDVSSEEGSEEFSPAALLDVEPKHDIGVLEDLLEPYSAKLISRLNRTAEFWPSLQGGLNFNDYDLLLSRATESLRRAIVYRDKAQDFSLDYLNDLLQRLTEFNSLFLRLEDIRKDGDTEQSIEAERAYMLSLSASADAFRQDSNNTGEALRDEATRDRLERLIKIRTARLSSERVAFSRSLHILKARNQRAEVGGSALNVLERLPNLERLCLANAQEGYWYLLAFAFGVTVIFKDIDYDGNEDEQHNHLLEFFRSYDFDATSGDFLDYLFYYAQHAESVLNRRLQDTSEYRVLIPLGGDNMEDQKRLAELLNSDNEMVVEIGDYYFKSLRDVRIVTAHLVGHSDEESLNLGDDNWRKFQGHIVGYMIPPRRDNDNPYERVPLINFGDSQMIQASSDNGFLRTPIRNCNPIGEWVFRVKDATGPDSNGGTLPQRYFLELVVVGK